MSKKQQSRLAIDESEIDRLMAEVEAANVVKKQEVVKEQVRVEVKKELELADPDLVYAVGKNIDGLYEIVEIQYDVNKSTARINKTVAEEKLVSVAYRICQDRNVKHEISQDLKRKRRK